MSSYSGSTDQRILVFLSFFFNATATTEIYTLSLHDALPIFEALCDRVAMLDRGHLVLYGDLQQDRKCTRLNSSHLVISYAVFCLKKKKVRFGYNRIHLVVNSDQLSNVSENLK